MLPRPKPRAVHTDDGPNAQKPGLAKLVQALRSAHIEHRTRETVPGVQDRLEFCLLWIEGDDVETFQARTQRWTRSAIYSRLTVLRRILGSPKYLRLDPYQTAQQYIQRHARYLRDIITEE